MKKLITPFIAFLFIMFFTSSLIAQEAFNIELFANYNRGDDRYSGSWVYVGPDGSEYALVGAKTGTAIYKVDDPLATEELGFIPGPSSNWREITVVGDYAYVTTEGSGPGQGMQVIDLTGLPNEASLITTYDATFARGHIIQKDIFEETPYVFVCGTDSTSGVHIIDVSNPFNPVEVGLYQPGYYIHDCHVRGNRLYACAFYEKTVDILDISDPANIQLITTLPDPGANTHSVSTTINEDYLFLADEQDGQPGRIFDISDLQNIEPVSIYTANYESLVHNPYITGDLAIISHNTEGLRILDIRDPYLPVEIAYYDTYDGPSGGFSGLWSACPYLPSGKIVGGDRTEGLYVWEHTGPRAGRIYGQVVDSLTGTPLTDALVILDNPFDTLELDNTDAAFEFGQLPGNYELSVIVEGYVDKVVTIDLQELDEQDLIIEMTSPISDLNEIVSAKQQILQISTNLISSELYIQCENSFLNSQLNIHNAQGQVKWTQVVNSDNLILNIENWPAGWYYISLDSKTILTPISQSFFKN